MADIGDDLLDSIRFQESKGDNYAMSGKGAAGPYGFMPATAREVGLKNRFDEPSSRIAARTYLGKLVDKYGGNIEDALMAYNWGMGNLAKLGKEKAPQETLNYVKEVTGRLKKKDIPTVEELEAQYGKKAMAMVREAPTLSGLKSSDIDAGIKKARNTVVETPEKTMLPSPSSLLGISEARAEEKPVSNERELQLNKTREDLPTVEELEAKYNGQHYSGVETVDELEAKYGKKEEKKIAAVTSEGKRKGESILEYAKRKKAEAESKPKGDFAQTIGEAVQGGAEAVLATGTGLIAKPVSDVAGLAAIPLHAAGVIEKSPEDVKRDVQEGLSYEPKTAFGKEAAEYNPLALVGKGIAAGAEALGRGAGKLTDSPAAERGVTEAVEQGVGLIGPLAGKTQLGKKVLPRSNAEVVSELSEQKGLNKVKDATRDAAQKEGLITPSEKGVRETVTGLTNANKLISEKNAVTATRLAAEEIGIPRGRAIEPATLEPIKEEHYKAYDKIINEAYGKETVPVASNYSSEWEMPTSKTRVTGLKVPTEFRAKISKLTKALEADMAERPAAFAPLTGALKLLKESEGVRELDPARTLREIKTLRASANTTYKSAAAKPLDLETASAQKFMANELESLFEKNLEGTPYMEEFRTARRQLAKIHLVEDALNQATGGIDIATIAAAGKKMPGLLTGKLKTIADFGNAFEQGAQKLKGTSAPISRFDLIVGGGSLATGHPIGAALVGGRLAAPVLAKAGMLQNKTPSYEVGKIRQNAPAALSLAGQFAADEEDSKLQYRMGDK